MSHASNGSNVVLTSSTDQHPSTPSATQSMSCDTLLSYSSQSTADVATSPMDLTTATSPPPTHETSTPETDAFPLLALPDHVMTRVLSLAWRTLDSPGRRALRLSSHTICRSVDQLVRILRLRLPLDFPHVAICTQPELNPMLHELVESGCSSNSAVQAAAQQFPASYQLDFTQPDDAWGTEFTEEGEPDEYLPGSDAADYNGIPAANHVPVPHATAHAGPSTSGSTPMSPSAAASTSDTTPQHASPSASDDVSVECPAHLDDMQDRAATDTAGPSSRDVAVHQQRARLCGSCCAAVTRISRRFPNLVQLEVNGGEEESFVPCKIFLETILSGWSSVRELALKPGSQISLTADDIMLLGKVCPQLDKLFIPAPLHKEALKCLPQALPNLNKLHFGKFWQVPPLGVLSPLTRLTSLQVRAVVMANDSMHGLSTLTSLRELRLGPVYHMTPAELEPIARLPALTCLHLWAMFGMNPDHDENGLSNADLQGFFRRLTNLRALSLHNFPGGQADDGLLRVLGSLPQLNALRINSKAKFTETPNPDVFPALKKLHVGGDKIEVNLLKGLGLGGTKRGLEELVLESVGAHMAEKVVKMVAKQGHLQRVCLRYVDGWQLSRLGELSCLSNLQSLNIVVKSEELKPKADVVQSLRRSLDGVKVTVSVNPALDLVRFEDDLLIE